MALKGLKVFKFLKVDVSPNPSPIITIPTIVSILFIQNNSNLDVFLGSSAFQRIKIPANGGSFSIVLIRSCFDLSTLYLRADGNTTVEVMYA
jgi:hypothetical protein